MDRFQYLFLMVGCLVLTLPLEFVFRARVWARLGRYLQALVVPFLLFNFVNEAAVYRRLWSYSPLYTTGLRIPRNYPIEEVVFFLVIPMCAVLTFETARNVYDGRVPPFRMWLRQPRPALHLLRATPIPHESEPSPGGRRLAVVSLIVGSVVAAMAALVAVLVQRSHGLAPSWMRRGFSRTYEATFGRIDWQYPDYSFLVLALLAIVLIVEWRLRSHVFLMRAYWATMAISAGFMVFVNGWLTKQSAPIVLYAPEEFVGGRLVWDIPTEDFAFGFALLTLVLICWSKLNGVQVSPPSNVTTSRTPNINGTDQKME